MTRSSQPTAASCAPASTPTGPAVWLLTELAWCQQCEARCTGIVAGRARRFYTCACGRYLHDADHLEHLVVTATANRERLRARDTTSALRPLLVWHLTQHQPPHQLRAMLHRHLTAVRIDPTGDQRLTLHWTRRPATPQTTLLAGDTTPTTSTVHHQGNR